jgi:outer membrane lipoprotein carrier protein
MFKKTSIVLCGLLICSVSFSMDAVEQLKNFSKMTKTSSGEFLQQQVSQTSDGKLKINKELTGTFIFSRPGKFVWNVLKPYEQKMLADGKQLIMWDKDLNQVTYRSVNQALATTPAAILFGDIPLDKYFDLKLVGEKSGLNWIELIPRPSSSGGGNDIPYSSIGVGMMNNLPQAMELKDNFGNVVLLSFKQIKTNITVLPNEFNFKNPPGVDVVKLP